MRLHDNNRRGGIFLYRQRRLQSCNPAYQVSDAPVSSDSTPLTRPTASQELHDAFNAVKSDPSKRGLIASIKSETLVPVSALPSTSSTFLSDLSNLSSHLKPNEALYILLRHDSSNTTSSPTFAAVTYVPDSAPVRQKMLFASTRLTLTRELGGENFTETLFCTVPEELSAEGWKKHEEHTKLENPLTEEERNLEGIKEAELTEVGGTGRRGAGYGGSSGLKIKAGDGVIEALGALGDGGFVTLVSSQLIMRT
jgi:twinfilin